MYDIHNNYNHSHLLITNGFITNQQNDQLPVGLL